MKALAAGTNYAEFRTAFPERLRRLDQATTAEPTVRAQIVKTANLIAEERNWDGAFAELTALDYFLADPATQASELKLDVTVPATETLAAELGMKNVNFDVQIPPFNLSLDVKLLGDKIGDILRGIFEDALAAKAIARLPIIPNYSRDDPYELYQRNRAALRSELEALIDVKQRPAAGVSRVIPGLMYKFAWGTGVYTGASAYDIDEHAMNTHALLFQHAKKFSRVAPSAIVFVHFPWSGEHLLPMGDAPLRFFKAMAHHFYQDYSGTAILASSLDGKFKSSILAQDAARHLSGVIFLKDTTATAADPTLLNVDASFLWNTTAHHPLTGSSFEHYLTSRGAMDLSRLP